MDGPDLDADGGADGLTGSVLGWLSVGRVPVLVLLLLFLLGFGASGLAVQGASEAVLGVTWPVGLAALPALAAGVLSMSLFGNALARVIPNDETAALRRADLVGLPGVVTGGTARADMPAQVRVADRHGTTHYLQAVPDDATATIASGTAVLVVSLEGARARIIADPHAGLGRGGADIGSTQSMTGRDTQQFGRG